MSSAGQVQRASGAGLAVLSLCLVQFVDVLGVTVVVTALPAMLASLHAPASYASLIATGYATFFGGLLMLGARLGDRFGPRRTIIVSLAVFAAAAVLSATASSAVTLMAGRCLQGAAAAGSVPSALRLLTTVTPEGAARRRAIAAWSAAGAAAGASGFVVGGIVTDLASWRTVFWAYLLVPPGWRPRSDGPCRATGTRIRRDHSTWPARRPSRGRNGLRDRDDPDSLPGRRAVGGLLLTAARCWRRVRARDRHAAAPLLPARLVGSPRLRQGAWGSLINTATTSSAITLVTLYLQNTLGRSPLDAAATLLPFSLAVIGGASPGHRAAAPVPAAIRDRPRPRWIAAADLALIPSPPPPLAVPACAPRRSRHRRPRSPLPAWAPKSTAHWRGSASGIINTAAQLGTAWRAVLLVIAAATTGTPGPGTPAPTVAWAVAATVAAVGAGCFAMAGRARPLRSQAKVASPGKPRIPGSGLTARRRSRPKSGSPGQEMRRSQSRRAPMTIIATPANRATARAAAGRERRAFRAKDPRQR